MNRTVLCGLLLLALATRSAPGAALDRSSVPAEVKWVAHIDVAEYRTTGASGLLRQLHPAKSRAGMHFLRTQLDLDPLNDLEGVTVYGTSYGQEDVVAIIRGKLDPALIDRALEKNPTHEKVRSGDYLLHKWKDPRSDTPCVAAFAKPDTILLAATAEQVLRAGSVVSGAEESLRDSGDNELEIPEGDGGQFLLAAADGVSEAMKKSRSQVFRNAKKAVFSAGTSGASLTAELKIDAGSAREAVQMENVLRGILAAALLNRDTKPELARLAGSVNIAVRGSSVTASLACTPAELKAFLKHN